MSQLYLSTEVLVIPTVDGKGATVDMKNIHKARARIHELAAMTRAKAGEFLAMLIRASREARDGRGLVKVHFGAWKKKLRKIRGEVILDRGPEKLKEKGLASTRSPAGSEDLRNALVDTDEKYDEAQDNLLKVEAALDHLENTVEELSMAYFSAQALIKGFEPSRSTSGGVGDDNPGELSEVERAQEFTKKYAVVSEDDYEGTGFGAPKI